MTTTEPSEITTVERETTTESSTAHTSTATEPLPITTTFEPESSTVHTQTTGPAMETSTVPNVETTTKEHTTSSITTVPVTTKPTPGIPKYIVTEKGVVCIVIEGFISFDIPYQKKDNTTVSLSSLVQTYLYLYIRCIFCFLFLFSCLSVCLFVNRGPL